MQEGFEATHAAAEATLPVDTLDFLPRHAGRAGHEVNGDTAAWARREARCAGYGMSVVVAGAVPVGRVAPFGGLGPRLVEAA